jgi:hypothetical protein
MRSLVATKGGCLQLGDGRSKMRWRRPFASTYININDIGSNRILFYLGSGSDQRPMRRLRCVAIALAVLVEPQSPAGCTVYCLAWGRCQRIPLLDSTTAIRLGNESAFTLSQSALSSFLQFRLDSAVSALRRVTGRVLTPRESSQFQYQFS